MPAPKCSNYRRSQNLGRSYTTPRSEEKSGRRVGGSGGSAAGGGLQVGRGPGLGQALLGALGVGWLLLPAEALGKDGEGPAVLGVAAQVVLADRLRVGGPAGGEEQGRQAGAQGGVPGRRLA